MVIWSSTQSYEYWVGLVSSRLVSHAQALGLPGLRPPCSIRMPLKHPRRLFRWLECCWAVSSTSCYTCAARSHTAILFESWGLFRRVYIVVQVVLSFVAWRLGPVSRSLLRGMSEPRPSHFAQVESSSLTKRLLIRQDYSVDGCMLRSATESPFGHDSK